ncbi:MAG: DUF1294 domain-containing protein [Planctomycetota bacterium]|nr:MAG: DUF1294 domain-containing protein [Planctomycetota bacterium]
MPLQLPAGQALRRAAAGRGAESCARRPAVHDHAARAGARLSVARPWLDGGGPVLLAVGAQAGLVGGAWWQGAAPRALWWLQLALGSALAFALFAWDKARAVGGRRRVRAAALLALAWLGGAAGSLAAMVVFRHKLRSPAFRFGVPIALALQLALGFWLTR